MARVMIELICHGCGIKFERYKGHYNANLKKGETRFYHDIVCWRENTKELAIKNSVQTRSDNWFINFFELIDKRIGLGPNGDCWEWRGTVNSVHGYGYIRIKGHNYRAHRVSYMILTSKVIDDGMILMHSCDNKICVNPDHLSEGTYKENMEDASKKGRMVHGEAVHSAKLTEDKVREIRLKYTPRKYSFQRLAEDYGVTQNAIRELILRKTWRHVL